MSANRCAPLVERKKIGFLDRFLTLDLSSDGYWDRNRVLISKIIGFYQFIFKWNHECSISNWFNFNDLSTIGEGELLKIM